KNESSPIRYCSCVYITTYQSKKATPVSSSR
ncbi:MPHOSPH9 isoform 22, partial [Pan troglodytes]